MHLGLVHHQFQLKLITLKNIMKLLQTLFLDQVAAKKL